jgi:hypothetical protein
LKSHQQSNDSRVVSVQKFPADEPRISGNF